MNTLLQPSGAANPATLPPYPCAPARKLATGLTAGLALGLALSLLSGCAGDRTSSPAAGGPSGNGAGNSAATTAAGTAGNTAGNAAGNTNGGGSESKIGGAAHYQAGGAADNSENTAADTASEARLYVDREYGFSITVPPRVQERNTFSPGVLDAGQWQYGSSAPTTGSARVALVLPGSNNITTGELRVGVATSPNSVQLCTQIPQGAQKQPGTITLDRVGFTNFRQQDAAMNHTMTAESYRAVYRNRCYAIDLLVYGTNPQVYDPPATAPFSHEDAMRQLRNMLPGFRFLK